MKVFTKTDSGEYLFTSTLCCMFEKQRVTIINKNIFGKVLEYGTPPYGR